MLIQNSVALPDSGQALEGNKKIEIVTVYNAGLTHNDGSYKMIETDQNIETLLKFPCVMPIKVIGENNDAFEIAVIPIFHKHFPTLKEGCLEFKKSSKAKYLAMTITVEAESKEQLDALYQELTDHPLVLWAL